MGNLKAFIQAMSSLYKGISVVSAAMVLVLAGCGQSNDYTVELKPRGDFIERKLIIYTTADGKPKAGITNSQSLKSSEKDELAAITALYPPHSLISVSNHYILKGDFSKELPNDVGGAGVYKHLATSLGEVGFYVERFRGNNNLASLSEQRFKAADRLADLFVGWSQMELGRQPGYRKLRQFLDVDFRHDLKTIIEYGWERQLVASYNTNATEEYGVRVGQYLYEHGYFTLEEIPGLFSESWDNQLRLRLRIQRMVARKMGVSETQPVPSLLSILTNETRLAKSFDKYFASTDIYRAKFKQWEKEKKTKPDLKKPEPDEFANQAIGFVLVYLMEPAGDNLTVRLSLPTPPIHSNGRWDEKLKQVIWETPIEVRTTNALHRPFSCYAIWVQANEVFQKDHLGKLALVGDDLTKYCLWRSSLESKLGDEWDAFLAGLHPGSGLIEKIDAFRFTGESNQEGTNDQQIICSISEYPRELLRKALNGLLGTLTIPSSP